MASLTILIDGAEQKFPLDNATVTLGRGLESDIRLKDIKASRRHCQIIKTPKGYQCLDLSSGNGTYVNGVQIKSQMLAPGDKITIGSTTIAFQDSAAGKPTARQAAPAPAPAAKVPAPAPARPAAAAASSRAPVEPPAPPAPSPATARAATARVQAVAATRKVTAKVDAVKPTSSQKDLKPVSQGALKPPSQPLQKVGSRPNLNKATARGARPARPATEAPPKKSPVLLIVAAVVVLGLGVGAYFLFFSGSHDSGDQAMTQIKQLMVKAEKADKADRVDEAIQDYEKALELCQGDRYKVRAAEIKKLIEGLKRRSPSSGGPSVRPDPKDPPGKGPDFQARRAEIAEKYKLSGDPASIDWGGAVKEWKDFLSLKPAAEAEGKAQNEIRLLGDRAREDFERVRKKAEALTQENKMAEAVDLLKQQLTRFKNTDQAAALENAIKQYDK